MWNMNIYQRERLFFIMLFSIVLTLFFATDCLGERSSEYLAYMDTGEGTFMLFKLELTNNKAASYLYCLSDAVLELLKDRTTENFRGYNQPGENLKSSDIKKIQLAFSKAKSVKIPLSHLSFQGNKLSFITEKINVEDVLNGNFAFDGIQKGKVVSGKMRIYYLNEEYPQSINLKFTQTK